MNKTIIDAIENDLIDHVGPIQTLEVRDYPTIAENVSERLYLPLDGIVVDDASDRQLKQIGYFIRNTWGVREVWVELTVSGKIRVEVRTQKSHTEGK